MQMMMKITRTTVKQGKVIVEGNIANSFRINDSGEIETLPVTVFVGSDKFIPQAGMFVSIPVKSLGFSKSKDERFPNKVIGESQYVFVKDSKTGNMLSEDDFNRVLDGAIQFAMGSESFEQYKGNYSRIYMKVKGDTVVEDRRNYDRSYSVRVSNPDFKFPLWAFINSQALDLSVGDVLSEITLAFQVKTDEKGSLVGGTHTITKGVLASGGEPF
jgi:hypothetical protein